MVRVLFAEDDPSVRRSLMMVLALEQDVEIAGHAADGKAPSLSRGSCGPMRSG